MGENVSQNKYDMIFDYVDMLNEELFGSRGFIKTSISHHSGYFHGCAIFSKKGCEIVINKITVVKWDISLLKNLIYHEVGHILSEIVLKDSHLLKVYNEKGDKISIEVDYDYDKQIMLLEKLPEWEILEVIADLYSFLMKPQGYFIFSNTAKKWCKATTKMGFKRYFARKNKILNFRDGLKVDISRIKLNPLIIEWIEIIFGLKWEVIRER